MNDTSGISLREAKKHLMMNIDEGVTCPCCGQFAKVYRRKLNSGMAVALIDMYRNSGTDWFNVREITLRGGDYGKLAYWGLIEPGDDTGIWRVTARGEEFIKGMIPVSQHANVYNGKLIELEGDLISISDALGDRFNYEELMATPGISKLSSDE